MNDPDHTEPDSDPEPGGTGLRAQCPSCRGAGMSVRQIAVAALDGDRGGTGLVHVTCTTCEGDGWLESLQPPG